MSRGLQYEIEGHPHRCRAIKRNSKDPRKIGKQCSKLAVTGHQFCKSHGGKKREVEVLGAGRSQRHLNAELQAQELPQVYSRFLSNKLSERLQELAGVPDELDLEQELALLRSVTVDAAQLYDLAINMPDQDASGKSISGVAEARIAAGTLLRECVGEVRDMVESIVSTQKERRETLTVPSLHIVVTQLVDLMYDELGDIAPHDKIRDLAKRMKDIRLPSQEIQGTLLTPDMDVREMDATIPSVPPGSDAPRIAQTESNQPEEKTA